MAQENTKSCDFSNADNNDFISTPIAPDANAESCKINTDQFSGLPNEDVASHLNNFIDLCDVQKKKDMDNDIVKLKLFRSHFEIMLKLGFHLCLKIVLIHGISVNMLLFPSIFLPLRSSPLGMIL